MESLCSLSAKVGRNAFGNNDLWQHPSRSFRHFPWKSNSSVKTDRGLTYPETALGPLELHFDQIRNTKQSFYQ